MTYFTENIDNALAGPSIKDAEFVRLTITNPLPLSTGSAYTTSTSYSFSNSYQPETITDDQEISSVATGTFTPLGGLLSITAQQRDLTATAYDLQITLIGIDPNKLNQVLEVTLNNGGPNYNAGLKGGRIQIWRGFYDTNYRLIDTPQLRFTGIVTSWHLTEDRQLEVDTYTLVLQCSSFKTVLENRYAGRHTNATSWNTYNGATQAPLYDSNGKPTNPLYDSGMDNVQAIFNVTFNFGLPVTT